jgi:hypothetical protein
MDRVDPIDEFERTFDKHIRLFIATLVIGGLFPAGFFVFLLVAVPGTLGPWILIYVPVELALTLYFARWIRRRLENVRSLPRAVRHRLAQSGPGKPMILVFDNGLVTTSGFQFRLFGSPSGGKMIPTAQEVPALIRGMVRMRSSLRIFRSRGPESLRLRLNSIQEALDSRFSNLFVFLPRASALPDPRRASWVSTATFDTGFRQLRPDRILEQIDSLATLLEDAATMAREMKA